MEHPTSSRPLRFVPPRDPRGPMLQKPMPRKNDRVDDWQPDSTRDTRRLSKELTKGKRIVSSKSRKRSVKGVKLRVIGGDLRGRPVPYHGDDLTRPMKDKTRESLFNILGKSIQGTAALDLFAGTGALAIESISRGASSAVAIEMNTKAAEIITKTTEDLAIDDRMRVIIGDAFRLAPSLIGTAAEAGGEEDATPDDDFMPPPQTLFVCPPYAMWDTAADRLLEIVRLSVDRCPIGSWIVIETEKWFDTNRLPGSDWDLRQYGNTILGFYRPAMVCGGDL